MLYCISIRFGNWSYVYCFLSKNIGLHSNIIQLKLKKKISHRHTHYETKSDFFSIRISRILRSVHNELTFFVRN